jgi:hypothetical protein
MYTVSLRRVHATILAVERAISTTYSKSVFVALGTQHAMRMHRISIMACPIHGILPHELINGTIFEQMLLNTKCVFGFSLQVWSETFFILSRVWRDMIKNVQWFTRQRTRHSCEILKKS